MKGETNSAPAPVDVLRTMDVVIDELGACARAGKMTFKHDAKHQSAVKEARDATAELIAAADAAVGALYSAAGESDTRTRLAKAVLRATGVRKGDAS